MKIRDVNMHGNNKTYNSMKPLFFLLKIFSLNCNIEDENTTLIIIKSLFTAIVLGLLNFTCLYYKLNYVYTALTISVKLTDFIQIIYDFCEYIVDLFFVYKYGGHICAQYFKQYVFIDNILNVTCFSFMRAKLLKIMGFFFTIWLTSSLIEYVAWYITYGWITPTSHAVLYLLLVIKMLTTLDLIAHIIHIGVRLKMIGDLMQNCYSSINTAENGIPIDCISNKSWLYNTKGTTTHIRKMYVNNTKAVKSLTCCYLLLTEQGAFVNKYFGVRILLNTLSLLSDMIKVTNLAVRMVLGTQETVYGSGYYPALSSLFRMVSCAAVFITLIDHAEYVYRQRERISHIMDHLLNNKDPDDSLRSAVLNFRQLIQDRPIVFNMAHFFNLNYSLLMSIASTVVTYTIILLQSVN